MPDTPWRIATMKPFPFGTVIAGLIVVLIPGGIYWFSHHPVKKPQENGQPPAAIIVTPPLSISTLQNTALGDATFMNETPIIETIPQPTSAAIKTEITPQRPPTTVTPDLARVVSHNGSSAEVTPGKATACSATAGCVTAQVPNEPRSSTRVDNFLFDW